MIESTLREFSSYYSECIKQEREVAPSNPDTLRVSGFPYCGLRHVYQRMIQLPYVNSAASDYYTSVGTITHLVIQHALGYGRRIYGNWECVAEGCTGRRTFSNINTCPICREVMSYKELIVNLRGVFPNLSPCHLDGIYRSREGLYYVLDYKTSSSKIIKQPDIDSYLPHIYNIAQIKAYCALVEQRFRVEIAGWILQYVARDNPMKIYRAIGESITENEKELILSKVETYSNHYGMVMNCKDYDTIKYLVENKPCKTPEQYQDEYKKFGGCPLAHICFERKRLMKELNRGWDEREDNFLTYMRPKNLKL